MTDTLSKIYKDIVSSVYSKLIPRVEYDLIPFNGGRKFVKMNFLRSDITGLAANIREKGITLETLHHAIFMSYIALKANLISLDETLGDFGLVHEMTHCLLFGPSVTPCAASLDDIIKMAQDLEKRLCNVSLNELSEYFTLYEEEPHS